eukprot:Rhum_TRINITY_DN3978_c0_g1::Rhum_TRINITY_DN3978_c0_g1_i1::g.12570::m.12570
MPEFNVSAGSLEDALARVEYSGDVTAAHFSPQARFMKKEMPGVSATFTGADLHGVYQALFGNGSSFLKQWRQSARGDKDFQEQSWRMSGDGCSGVRLFKCQTKVKETVFSNWVNFIERQRYAAYSDGSGSKVLVVQFVSMTPTVTFGESFRCEALLRFTESANAVTLKCYTYIHFMKSCLLEGKVTSVGTEETIKSFRFFVKLSPPVVDKYMATHGKKKKADSLPARVEPAAAPAAAAAAAAAAPAAAPPAAQA